MLITRCALSFVASDRFEVMTSATIAETIATHAPPMIQRSRRLTRDRANAGIGGAGATEVVVFVRTEVNGSDCSTLVGTSGQRASSVNPR